MILLSIGGGGAVASTPTGISKTSEHLGFRSQTGGSHNGSGSNTLTFNYTIGAGHTSSARGRFLMRQAMSINFSIK